MRRGSVHGASAGPEGVTVARLGQLERAVMDTLWDLAAARPAERFTVREVAQTLPNHAYTTVLTVIDRLEKKGLVERFPDSRTYHYRPTGSRESYVAELMTEALDTTTDRTAALVRFAQSVRPDEAAMLRGVLERLERSEDPR